jgi:hypothetical protein
MDVTVLIVLDVGHPIFTEVHESRQRAKESLLDWIADSWVSEHMGDMGDYDDDDHIIGSYFQENEDYGYVMEDHQVEVNAPGNVPVQDIYLTEGYCRILIASLKAFPIPAARKLLIDANEIPAGNKHGAAKAISHLIEALER